MGARLCDEEQFDQAIRYFRRALAIGDEPYAHYHLGLAYRGNNEFGAAIAEISKAIELNPSVPEYYYERSLIWGHMGDRVNASRDFRKALILDAHYERIEDIREATKVLREAFAGEPILEGSCPIVCCPAYCCHFSSELVLHGVNIGAWKLHSIRLILKEGGFPEEEYIKKLTYLGEKYIHLLIPPHHILRQGKGRFVFYPARGRQKIDGELMKSLPKGTDYRTLVWINKNARPCVFLREKRCTIHDAGGETGLDSCRQFLCLTGFVFVALIHMGLIEKDRLTFRGMTELNEIALEALLLLAENMDGSKALFSFLKRNDLAVDSVRYF